MILTLKTLKSAAKVLRANGEAPLSHSDALELIARGAGYADWNTASGLLQQHRGRSWRPVEALQTLPLKEGRWVLRALDEALFCATRLAALRTPMGLTLVCGDGVRLRAAMRFMARGWGILTEGTTHNVVVIGDEEARLGISALPSIQTEASKPGEGATVLKIVGPGVPLYVDDNPDRYIGSGLTIGLPTSDPGEAAHWLAKRSLASPCMRLVMIEEDCEIPEPVDTEVVRLQPNFRVKIWGRLGDSVMGELECEAMPDRPHRMGRIEPSSPAETLAFQAEAFRLGRSVQQHLEVLIQEGKAAARAEDERLVDGLYHYNSSVAAKTFRQLNERPSFRKVHFASPTNPGVKLAVWKDPLGRVTISCPRTVTLKGLLHAVEGLLSLSRDEDDWEFARIEAELQTLLDRGEVHREQTYRREIHPSDEFKAVMSSVDREVQTGGVEYGIAAHLEERLRALIGW